jgi:hypothetical protein
MEIEVLPSEHDLATPTVQVEIEDDTLRREILIGKRYELRKRIYGNLKSGVQIWEAVDRKWQFFDDAGNEVDRRVCLKLFPLPRTHLRNDALERARREAAAPDQFSPHNTVQVLDFIESGTYACIVFQYLQTEPDPTQPDNQPLYLYTSLYEYVNKPHISMGDMMEIFKQWCEWVDHAAQSNRFGSDHKTTNAFLFLDTTALTPQQRIHLIISDLGSMPEVYNGRYEHQFHKLRSPGTVTYCSAERLAYTYAEDPADRKVLTFDQLKAEIFSLITIWYELVTGKNPYTVWIEAINYKDTILQEAHAQNIPEYAREAYIEEKLNDAYFNLKVDENNEPLDQRHYFTIPQDIAWCLKTYLNCDVDRLQEAIWKGAAPEEERFAAPMDMLNEIAACFPPKAA